MSQLKVHIETIEIHDQQEFEGREDTLAGIWFEKSVRQKMKNRIFCGWLTTVQDVLLFLPKGNVLSQRGSRGPKRIGRTNTPLQQEECPEIELCC